MAIVTNRHNAPRSLVAFAEAPHYDSEGSDYTVTQLIDSPRVRILRKQHADEIEVDPYESIFMLVGTAIHSIAEAHTIEDTTEERIHLSVDGGAVDVSGAIDLYYENEDGTYTIGDYKFTSIHSLRFPQKWEDQLGMYAFLFENGTVPGVTKPTVGKLEVYAILRDWSWRQSKNDREYPQTPGVTVQIPLRSENERSAFFFRRHATHRLAAQLHRAGTIVRCTPEEMWQKEETFAVRSRQRDDAATKRAGKSRAIRVLNSEEQAEAYIDEADNDDYYVESRPGERTRCMSFCDVAKFCDQWKEFESGEG